MNCVQQKELRQRRSGNHFISLQACLESRNFLDLLATFASASKKQKTKKKEGGAWD